MPRINKLPEDDAPSREDKIILQDSISNETRYSIIDDIVKLTDISSSMFSVLNFGAKGDGSTDDTAAFNDALTAGAGATVFIPSGTYALTPGTLSNIPAGTKIQGAGIGETTLQCITGFNGNNNLIQIVSVANVEISDMTIDGNKANNTNFQYGLYISASSNVSAHNLLVQNWNGDGVQLYDCTACMVHDVFSTGNVYHGFEVEQCKGCTVQSCRGYSNSVHGLIITPGEVDSNGSQGNHIIGCSFEDNTQFGICVNWDNANTGAHLSEGNIIMGNSITGNAQYGVCFYGESLTIFTNNYIYNNGFFGIYIYQSAYNRITSNYFHNNSSASNGGYDEIALEGATDGYASSNNLIEANVIIIDGTNKARYAINELNAGDGPNIVMNNVTPTAGTAGTLNIQNSGTQLGPVDTSTDQTVNGHKTFGHTVTASQGYEVAANAALASGMGLDAPFGTAALRFYNGNSGGNVQLVAPNGSVDVYAGGNNSFTAASDHLDAHTYPIENVGNPTSAQDAATKNYVDIAGWSSVPATATSTGVAGQKAYDSSYIYICVATNTWKRSALSSW